MKVAVIGGGPGGLYLAILLRRADPTTQVTVWERNRIEDTFGFGVVLSDATEGILAEADAETHQAMAQAMHRWGDIDVHIGGECITSGGHGFCGISRKTLLEILRDRAKQLGTDLRELTEAPPVAELLTTHDLVVAADGVNSAVREANVGTLRRHGGPPPQPVRLARHLPSLPQSFFFSFQQNAHGLWRVHAYQYAEGESTFIVETTDAAWKAAGLDGADEAATIAYCETLFKKELEGHRLVANRSIWRQFPTIKCASWSDGRLVLLGDAAHTAHFSVGSGTKLAMEDSIALAKVLQSSADVAENLATYERERRPGVESVQRAAQASLEWFEATERYDDLEPLQFAYSLLTRSLRITHENLRTRDPAFVERVERWYADKAGVKPVAGKNSPPPFLTPFALRELKLVNRIVVSPMCQYSAVDGVPNDWHLQHLGSRAIGGAGLVMTEMTDVSPDGRISPGCTGIYSDAQVAGWRRIVAFVREHAPDTKIGMQLGHAGRKGATRLMWEGDNRPLERGAWPIMSASAIPWKPENQVPKEMTRKDMDLVRSEFARATERALESGFDLVEVHLAHGYLLASFISPLTNRRTDEYGGSLANRMRFPLEVLGAVRAAWPAEKPLTARVSATDWHPDGLTGAESVEVARLIARAGVDAVDVSAGQTIPDQRPIYGRAFQTPVCRPDPPRGGHGHPGGGEHPEPRGRERDPGRGSRRPGADGAGPPLGSLLDPARGVRTRAPDPVAAAV